MLTALGKQQPSMMPSSASAAGAAASETQAVAFQPAATQTSPPLQAGTAAELASTVGRLPNTLPAEALPLVASLTTTNEEKLRKIFWRLKGRPEVQAAIQSFIRDIGILVQSEIPFKIGDEVGLCLALPGDLRFPEKAIAGRVYLVNFQTLAGKKVREIGIQLNNGTSAECAALIRKIRGWVI